MINVIASFWNGLTAPYGTEEKRHCHHEKKMRAGISEERLDEMLAASCDASDPIAVY